MSDLLHNRPKVLVGPSEFFTPRGRIGRLQYLWAWAVQVALLGLGFGSDAALDFIGSDGNISDDTAGLLAMVITACGLILTFALLYTLFCLVAKRLHDVGLHGLLALLIFAGLIPSMILAFGESFIPEGFIGDALNLISMVGYGLATLVFLALSVWPGQHGDNRFGPAARVVSE